MKKLINIIKTRYVKEELEEFNNLLDNINVARELFPDKVNFDKVLAGSIETVKILCMVNLDLEAVLASLSLDLIKNKMVNIENLELNKNSVKLIESVLDIENIIYDNNKADINNLRGMFVAVAKDVRVLIIKLSDVLNKARRFNELSAEENKQHHIEIKEIYAPLAARLGLSFIKSELQDENLKYFNPEAYDQLAKELLVHEDDRKIQISKSITIVQKLLKDMGIDGEVKGRVKHISSVYKKLEDKDGLYEIFDLNAIRIIVKTVNECYAVLGCIHTYFKPMENRFKDYIARPKTNGYKSLHTTVLLENLEPLEVQIRTEEMHNHAEYGVAAHWLYKEKKTQGNSLDKRLTWIRQMIENQEALSASEIIDNLKSDVYAGEIFVQTPKGNILELPADSTPVDFAYNIHSAVGNKCIGAKVNGKMVPLTYKLNNGDLVEVITSGASKGPSRDWLKIVKSGAARNKINAFFRKEMKEDNIKKGKSILEQTAKQKNVQLHKVIDNKWMQELYDRYSLTGMDDMYASVGFGSLSGNQVITRLQKIYDEHNQTREKAVIIRPIVKANNPRTIKGDAVIVKGLNNILTRFAKCCTPVPGDEIVAFISRGRGATIHRATCSTLDHVEPERILEAEWGNISNSFYNAELNILAGTGTGVLASITNKIADLKINISAITSNKIANDRMLVNIMVNINEQEQLANLIKKINNISQVYDIYRGNNH